MAIAAATGTRHPLDELDGDEVRAAAAAAREELLALGGDETSVVRFAAVTLKPPPKAEVKAWLATKGSSGSEQPPPERRAEVIATVLPAGNSYEVEVGGLSGSKGVVASLSKLSDGAQPLLSPDDCALAEEIVRADASVAALLREQYGIGSMDEIVADPWSVHLAGGPAEADIMGGGTKRLVQTFLYGRSDAADNAYAHPIACVPVVDLLSRKVVHVDQAEPAYAPMPSAPYNYHRDGLARNEVLPSEWREDVPKPLEITQPEGPSFSVDGSTVRWQGWELHLGFNYREGIVLSDVRFQDRPVLWRASLVEMAVPYGDPASTYARKCAFDVGDYGLGYCANSLELGCDCLGHIRYFDATLADSSGEPYEVKKAICMHEEDVGLMWKHVEYRTGHSESRRARRLVISSIATVVNYEYLFYWYLSMDGSIELEIKLSGELSTNQLSPGEGPAPAHGTLVAPGVNAQVHQHMFSARLDMSVDGDSNTVVESEVVPLPVDAETNPYGNAFVPQYTRLESEKQAARLGDPARSRTWRIESQRENPISGKPTAYKLVPAHSSQVLITAPSSAVAKRGGFATKSLWVTRYSDDERYPAGEYTVQSTGDGGGLLEWVEADESIVAEDVVLWHTFGVTHVPRVEDFPVMPCESAGFHLKPDGFSLCNPGIDLPPSRSAASRQDGCCSEGGDGSPAAAAAGVGGRRGAVPALFLGRRRPARPERAPHRQRRARVGAGRPRLAAAAVRLPPALAG